MLPRKHWAGVEDAWVLGGPRPAIAIKARQFRYSSWLRGMRIRNHDKGIELTDSILFSIENSYFGDLTSVGVEVTNLGHAARYIGNTFVRNGRYAMHLRGNAVVVLNNTFEYTGYDGKTRLRGSDRVLSLTTVDGGFVIAGNYFEENGDGATPGRSNIFVTGGGRGGVIEGNFLDAIVLTPAWTAALERNLYLHNVSAVHVRGNLMKNATTWDVVASGSSDDIMAIGNSTTKPMALPTNAWSRLASNVKRWTPPRMAAGAQIITTLRVGGAKYGDAVLVAFDTDLQGIQLTGYVSAPDTVTVVLRNGTSGPVDLPNGVLRVDLLQH